MASSDPFCISIILKEAIIFSDGNYNGTTAVLIQVKLTQ